MKKLTLFFAVLVCSLVVQASALNYFTFSLTGAQESPVNGSPAAGGGVAVFDPLTDTITVNAFFVGLSAPATASHIHLGALGVPGPVIVSLVSYTPAATAGSIVSGTLAFPVANVGDLLAGNTYLNIHDSIYPGGEIRGQLIPTVVPEPATFAMLGLGLIALGRFASRNSAKSVWQE